VNTDKETEDKPDSKRDDKCDGKGQPPNSGPKTKFQASLNQSHAQINDFMALNNKKNKNEDISKEKESKDNLKKSRSADKSKMNLNKFIEKDNEFDVVEEVDLNLEVNKSEDEILSNQINEVDQEKMDEIPSLFDKN